MATEVPTEEQIRDLGWNSITPGSDDAGNLMVIAQQLNHISLLLLAIYELIPEDEG